MGFVIAIFVQIAMVATVSPSSPDAGPSAPATVVEPWTVYPPQPPAAPAADDGAEDVAPTDEEPAPADEPAAVGDPVRVVIPAIDVDETIVPVGLLDTGAMEVPDFGLVGWYTPGPRPGEAGPAVLAGHVDSRSGPDVFFRLRELEPGDEIRVIDADGEELRYTVRASEQTPKDELPVDRIWNDTDEPVLRLITCGGEFDRSARSYRDNTIVYADPAP